MIRKFKIAFQLLYVWVSSDYRRKYYTGIYRQLIKNCGVNVVFEGKLVITDPRQLIIGSNVTIGRNCEFISDGGIYIEDGAFIGSNSRINSMRTKKKLGEISSLEINQLGTVIITKNSILAKGSVVTPDVFLNHIENHPIHETHAFSEEQKNLFFVVSTGRSGTNAIAKLLSNHKLIDCRHEQKFILNRLSTELAHGIKSREEVKAELISVYLNCSNIITGKKVYGECDLKNSNLISLLHEIFPQAKFIWLIRRADEFVSSAFARRWFDEYEYSFPHKKIFSPDTDTNEAFFDKYRLEYSRYRLNGYECGSLSSNEWQKMDCFERNCWYWSYWNGMIEKELSALPSDRIHFVKLEELSDKNSDLCTFLKVDITDIPFEITNKAYHKVIKKQDWNSGQQMAYVKWCTQGMEKWYNE